MEIVLVKIDDLKPTEYNPRKASQKEFDDVRSSIEKFGLVEPIVVNSAENRKNIIIGGHLRWRVARVMGFTEMPVVYVNIPDIEKEKELNLRLNKNLGGWDWNLLAKFTEEELTNIGFNNDELDKIFGLERAEDFNAQEEFEKVIKEPRGVKDGDLWKLGEHKLVIGDCTKKENWQRVLGEERFDYLFTDPPYLLAYCKTKGRKAKTKDGMKWKNDTIYSAVGETDAKGKPKGFGASQNRSYEGVEMKGGVPEYDEWLSIANEFQNPKGANVMIFENWKNLPKLWLVIEKYWKVQNMIIWHLPNRSQGFSAPHKFFSKYDIAPLAGNGIQNEDYEGELEEYLFEKGQKLLDSYEVILYGQKGKSEWSKEKGTPWAKVTDHITWVASTEKSGGQSVIFGTKPLQILVPYVKILSPRNGIVMEPFAGSFSTGIACEIMKRRCRAIEISPIYGELCINRWEKFTGFKAEKIG